MAEAQLWLWLFCGCGCVRMRVVINLLSTRRGVAEYSVCGSSP